MAELRISVGKGTPPVLVLAGEVDLATAHDLEEAIQRLLAHGADTLAIDMSQVSYLDSNGIGVLMRAVRTCQERGGEVRIVGISDRALRVMRLISLDRVIRFYPNGTQAPP